MTRPPGPVAGRRVGVFTASGGAGLWVVDACAEHGLDVPELPAAEQAGILARLPYYASASNPVDYTAGASDEHGVTAALAGLAGSSSVDVVVLVMSLTVAAGLADRVRPLVDLVAAAGKPLVVQSYTHPVPEAVAVLADFKIPWFVNQQGLGRTLAALADRHDAERRPTESAADRARPSAGTAERVVPEHAVKAWLRDAGLPVPDGRLVGTEAEALAAGAELGYPVVVKLQSAEVSHKSDVGAVVVGVAGPDELIGAYHQVVAAAPVGQPIDGVLVEGMVTAGREMMIGVIGDPDLGPFVVIGSGGADAELAADTQILTAPVTTEAARAAIGRLRAARGLSGWRGGPPADVTALAELVAAVSRWVLDLDDEVAELDLNPVILHPAGQGVDIVDGLAVVRSPVAASE